MSLIVKEKDGEYLFSEKGDKYLFSVSVFLTLYCLVKREGRHFYMGIINWSSVHIPGVKELSQALKEKDEMNSQFLCSPLNYCVVKLEGRCFSIFYDGLVLCAFYVYKRKCPRP